MMRRVAAVSRPVCRASLAGACRRHQDVDSPGRRSGPGRGKRCPSRAPESEGSLNSPCSATSAPASASSTSSASRWRKVHERFPFELVITVGDNLYGSQRPKDFKKKFELPYKPLLDAGVKFYASLGQPRRARAALLQAVQHGRQAVLHLQGAEAERPVLRARQHLPRPGADRVAREGAGRLRETTGRSRTSITRCTRRASGTARRRACARCSSRCS